MVARMLTGSSKNNLLSNLHVAIDPILQDSKEAPSNANCIRVSMFPTTSASDRDVASSRLSWPRGRPFAISFN
eukprot:2553675-Rhodomonas_salina.1